MQVCTVVHRALLTCAILTFPPFFGQCPKENIFFAGGFPLGDCFTDNTTRQIFNDISFSFYQTVNHEVDGAVQNYEEPEIKVVVVIFWIGLFH